MFFSTGDETNSQTKIRYWVSIKDFIQSNSLFELENAKLYDFSRGSRNLLVSTAS